MFADALTEIAVLRRDECIGAEGPYLATRLACEAARDAYATKLARCDHAAATAERIRLLEARAKAGDIAPDLLAEIAASFEAILGARVDVAFPPDDVGSHEREPGVAA